MKRENAKSKAGPVQLPPTLSGAAGLTRRALHPEIETRLSAWWSGAWWHRAAAEAVLLGRWQEIVDQRSRELYLARFWLSPPLDGEASDRTVPEAASSCLLHWIVRPDPNGAFHDHPWDFQSVVISGRYREERRDGIDDDRSWFVDLHGPSRGLIVRAASDLHRIVEVLGDTWTLVTTGPRVREWGFVSAGSTQWLPYRDFLVRCGRSESGVEAPQKGE